MAAARSLLMAVAWTVALTNVTAHSSVIGLQPEIRVPWLARSGWSPDEYERWLRDRLREVLLDPSR